MFVLGISCFYHDAAAAIIYNGQLLAAAEEERFSRKKHDHSFPEHAINFCLAKAGIRAEDLDLIVFYEKPFRKFDRIMMSSIATWPKSMTSFREAMIVWLLDKLWARDIIQEKLGVMRDKIVFCPHHVSHAASAFYPSDFDKAAVLTADGVGEWSCAARGSAWDTKISIDDEMRYPHSLGLLYSAFTAFLGFQVNEGEYKVMGMAPYGEPRFTDLIFEKLIELHEDGSFRLNMDYFAYHHSASRSFTSKFTDLFGRPRTPEESNLLDPHYADIAASIQQATEEILIAQATYLQRKSGHRNLCFAGGTALNSCANTKILCNSGFERMYIQPSAGDGGGALGAALWGYYNVLGGTERYKMTHVYWGEEYSDEEIDKFLRNAGCAYEELPDMDYVNREVAKRLENGQVVGWMQGRFEWGPRALGARSILADPRVAQMKDIVNARIKFREPFRPFAPSVLAEHAEEYFGITNVDSVDPVRFMLMVLQVREEMKAVIPAVTHVDGTSRIQAVHKADCPLYHGVISEFYRRTGVPVVLNTSFNLRGEPIVNTPEEAYSTFARSDMDALVMGRFLVSRRDASQGRMIQGAELEKWAHAPDRAFGTENRPQDATDDSAYAVKEHSHADGKTILTQALIFLVVAFVVLEVFLRVFVPNTNMQVRGMYSDAENGVKLTPGWHGRVHNGEFDVKIKIDKNGRREIPSAKATSSYQQMGKGHKILALGDSFTFGCWSPADKTWLSAVNHITGAEIINAGVPNAGTDAELDILKRSEVTDVVLVAFYTGNDFYDNMVGMSGFMTDGGCLVLTPEANARWSKYDCLKGGKADTKSEAKDAGKDGVKPHSSYPFWRRWLRRSYIYQFANGIISLASSRLQPSSAEAWYLKEYTPEMSEAAEWTTAYLEKIKNTAQTRGSRFALVVIPSATQVYDEDWKAWLKSSKLSEDKFDREKPRHFILDWAEHNGVAALDLLPALVNRERLYYKSDMHWNDLGHFCAGEAVSQFLMREGMFDYTSAEEGEDIPEQGEELEL